MNLQERIQELIIRIIKSIFPNTTNHYNTLFRGTAILLIF